MASGRLRADSMDSATRRLTGPPVPPKEVLSKLGGNAGRRRESVGRERGLSDSSGIGGSSSVAREKSAKSTMGNSKRTPAQLVLQNVFARFVRAAELKVSGLIYMQPLVSWC